MPIFNILVFPGALYTIVFGLFLAGLDRKVIAHMQKRIGPPIRQPWYDFFKLCGKERIIPEQANKIIYTLAPIVSFLCLSFLMLFIPMMGYIKYTWSADMIVILYLLTIPGVCLILGGSSSASPYAAIGISREMVTMIAYELPLVVILLTIAKKIGGEHLIFSMRALSDWQAINGCLGLKGAMIPAAIAMLFVIPAEAGTQPFDVAEAEMEICEGPLVEYSGAYLAVYKLCSAMKVFVMSALFTSLFFCGVRTGSVPLDILIYAAITTLVSLVCVTLFHAVTARLKVEHLFKFFWTFVLGLSVISLALVWFGL